MAGKRDKVVKNEGSGNEETTDQAESDQKDDGSVHEAMEQSKVQKSDEKQSAGENEKVEEQATNDVEGSSESSDKDENVGD